MAAGLVKVGSPTILALLHVLLLFDHSPGINLHQLTASAGGTADRYSFNGNGS